MIKTLLDNPKCKELVQFVLRVNGGATDKPAIVLEPAKSGAPWASVSKYGGLTKFTEFWFDSSSELMSFVVCTRLTYHKMKAKGYNHNLNQL